MPVSPSAKLQDPERLTVRVGDTEVAIISAGNGPPLLVLHDELGFPGWMSWNAALAHDRTLWIPLQPGFGDTPRVDWIRSYRDLGSFYARFLRESNLAPIDVVGFSAGGYIAAEMAASCPSLFRRMVLVAPLGVRPAEGEIFDFLAATPLTHLAATISNRGAPEVTHIYSEGMTPDGTMTPEQFIRFEDARAETARLGWEPFMFDPSLPHLLEGVTSLPTLLLWGEEDLICPRGCVDVYHRAVKDSKLTTMPGVGHRPEVEDPETFVTHVSSFFSE